MPPRPCEMDRHLSPMCVRGEEKDIQLKRRMKDANFFFRSPCLTSSFLLPSSSRASTTPWSPSPETTVSLSRPPTRPRAARNVPLSVPRSRRKRRRRRRKQKKAPRLPLLLLPLLRAASPQRLTRERTTAMNRSAAQPRRGPSPAHSTAGQAGTPARRSRSRRAGARRASWIPRR